MLSARTSTSPLAGTTSRYHTSSGTTPLHGVRPTPEAVASSVVPAVGTQVVPSGSRMAPPQASLAGGGPGGTTAPASVVKVTLTWAEPLPPTQLATIVAV